LCFFGRIVPSDAPQNHGPPQKGIRKTNLQALGRSSFKSLQSQTNPKPKNRLPLNRLEACSRATKQAKGGSARAVSHAPSLTERGHALSVARLLRRIIVRTKNWK
jgi:hypothetical protein